MKDQIASITTFKNLTVFEIVFVTVTSVALGVSFWGWTFIYEIFKPILKIYGLNYLSAGFWIFASVFASNIIRKPGVAILASLVAAFIQSLFTQWGLMSLCWGLVQGLGAELVFLFFSYRRWNLWVLILASILSSIFSYALDYFLYQYYQAEVRLQITQLVSFVISSIFLSGVLAYFISKRLQSAGVLNRFLIVKKHV